VIVVDTNVLAYLYLPGKYSAAAEKLLLSDGEWAMPRLWRSEFIALAEHLDGKFVSADAKLCKVFSHRATALARA
jgi:predicted nucleic acid-binding protein